MNLDQSRAIEESPASTLARRHLGSRRAVWIPAFLILFATLWRYYEPYRPTGLCGIGFESLQLACSLKQNRSFSDPFQSMPTGPSAHLAPLYPAFISILMKLGGEYTNAGLLLGWACIIVIGIHLALLPFLTRRCGLGIGSGAIAAGVFLLAKVRPYAIWESFYVALIAVALSFLMFDLVGGRASTVRIASASVLWGIMLWLAPVPVVVMLAWLIWLLVSGNLSRKQWLALAIIPFLIISPWVVRNHRVFGHFIFVRDNLGLELAVSNNSCAAFAIKSNQLNHCFEENHPNKSLVEAETVKQLGEYEYNRRRLREGLSRMADNPTHFASLTAQRFIAFWLPTPSGNPFGETQIPAAHLLVWLMTLLSLPGLWLMWKKNQAAAVILMLWLVLFPPIYYLIQFDERYRSAILWATFVPAGFFLQELSSGVWRAFRPGLSEKR